MLRLRTKDEKIDVTSLNELIRIGKYLLKILFVVSVASLIFLGSYLLKA